MVQGPYARISVLRPHDGDTVDFEAGYMRHMEWHRQAKDPWSWYAWTIWAGERQRSLVYATFGHSAEELDAAVSPADDERDNISNVTPHGHFAGHALCEFLPSLSRGDGVPSPIARVEMTTVDVRPGAHGGFEAALAQYQPSLPAETLWYRVLAGGSAPRYVRLRPRRNVSALLDTIRKESLPAAINDVVAKATVEIMNLRAPMCYRVEVQS